MTPRKKSSPAPLRRDRRGFTTPIFLAVVFIALVGVTIMSGKAHLSNSLQAHGTEIRRNLEVLQRNFFTSVDCASTVAYAPNTLACAQWKAYSSASGVPTGCPSGPAGQCYIQVFGFGSQYATGMTQVSGPIGIAAGISLRARCDRNGTIVPEVQVMNLTTGAPSAINQLFYARDYWIDIFHNVSTANNPFMAATCRP